MKLITKTIDLDSFLASVALSIVAGIIYCPIHEIWIRPYLIIGLSENYPETQPGDLFYVGDVGFGLMDDPTVLLGGRISTFVYVSVLLLSYLAARRFCQ